MYHIKICIPISTIILIIYYIIYILIIYYIYETIYNEELAHVFLESEKFHSLPSASWRPRIASGIIQSESKGLRTGELMV